MNILIIEDDLWLGTKISEVFRDTVITNRVTLIHSFKDFIAEYNNINPYDMILTDLNLWNYHSPEWFDIIKKVRQISTAIPIIVISGYDDIDKLRYAFSLWISDYIIKPVRLRELEVRVLNWFHAYYSNKLSHSEKVFSYKNFSYNIDQNNFYYKWEYIPLSKNNKYILSLFFSQPEKILTEEYLCEKLWWDITYSWDRNIRINILRLKQKLAIYWLDACIQNIRSEWYIFSEKKLF